MASTAPEAGVGGNQVSSRRQEIKEILTKLNQTLELIISGNPPASAFFSLGYKIKTTENGKVILHNLQLPQIAIEFKKINGTLQYNGYTIKNNYHPSNNSTTY